MSLDEVVGQEHITSALKRALGSGKISHAYLFTGPRGVGKTSIARILAHEVNGLSYESEGQHLDIIEIDAASNNGVEDVRDLRDKVHVAPTSSKYKVYIIDEVHMLSKAAFNALLKTLEEPPEHVIFILATTELHKVPETIVSRTQQYTFRPVGQDKVVAHLRHIADEEKVKISDDALGLIARHGGGSFRDSISLLDQARHVSDEISLEAVELLLGRASDDAVSGLIGHVGERDLQAIIGDLDAFRQQGVQPTQLASQLIEALRADIPRGVAGFSTAEVLRLIEGLSEVSGAHDPRIALEVRLLEAATIDDMPARAVPPAASARPRSVVQAPKPVTPASAPSIPKQTEAKAPPQPTAEPTDEVQAELAPPSSDHVMTAEQWHGVLADINKQYNTLYGILRMAQPEFAPGKVNLVFRHAFHQKRASDAKNKGYILDAVGRICGVGLIVDCVVGEANEQPATAEAIVSTNLETAPEPAAPTPPSPAEAASPAALANISNIFGGAEVLDS